VALGLGAVLASQSGFLETLKYLGAAYLIYAGVRQVVADPTAVQIRLSGNEHRSHTRLFAEGFAVMSLNPRSFLFFLAFFPLFIDTKKSLTLQFWTLGATFAIVGATALLLYAWFASAMRVFLADTAKRRLQTRIVGLLLIVSGCWFAVTNVTPP
jgi:threonine/homoserine/homoserine lactone efflux protein